MRKILLTFTLLWLISSNIYSQSDPHFSLFEYTQNMYNPGAAGMNEAMCVTSVHRQQWLGFKGEGRPITTIFSFDSPVLKNTAGAGFIVTQDKIGVQTDLNIRLNGAYKFNTDAGTIAAGLGIGVINRVMNPNWSTPDQLFNGSTPYSDPTLPHMDNKTVFDINIGGSFISKNYSGTYFWGGLAATHLTQPEVSFSEEIPSYISTHLYIMGGLNYSLPNPSYDLLGSILVQSDRFTKAELQINGKLLYQKKFWGGLSFRFLDAIVPMVGIHLVNGISVGYSYDIVLSKLSTSGSHELMLRYCFNIVKSPGRGSAVRNVRTL